MLAEVGNRDGGRLRCVISTADGMVPALVEPGIRTLIMNGATFEVLRVVAGDTITTLEAPSYHGTGNDLSYELLIAQRQALRRSGGTIPWFSGRYEDEVTETSPFAKDLGALVHVEHRRGTRAKLYEQLTKLRYETIERVMVLGQAFPLSPFFRVPMTSWVHRNKVSRVHGRRGFAALMLLEDCSTTEAGENFLGLFFALRKFSMQRKDILGREKQRAGDDDWLIMVFSALFQAMNIPPASRPSAPQLRLFVDLCMSGFTTSE
ncbi:unnamed protein product [Alternaria alternata]